MKHGLSIILWLTVGMAWGQVQVERSWLDSDTMMLGMPNAWHVHVMVPAGAVLDVAPSDTMQGLEWWGPPVVDTDSVAGGRLRLHVRIPFSGFDSGRLRPAVTWQVQDTAGSQSLNVPTPAVYIYWPKIDTTEGLRPIRPVLSPPPLPGRPEWQAAQRWWWLLVLIAIGLGGLIFWWFWRRRRQETALEKKLSPYEYARYRLDKLAAEKAWQRSKIPYYYTELSHIVRKFLEDEHHIPALEWPSSTLVEHLARHHVSGDLDTLRRFLELTDYVKFARYQPAEREHDTVMQWAREIVESYHKKDEMTAAEVNENTRRESS